MPECGVNTLQTQTAARQRPGTPNRSDPTADAGTVTMATNPPSTHQPKRKQDTATPLIPQTKHRLTGSTGSSHPRKRGKRAGLQPREAWKMEVPDWSEVGDEKEPNLNNLLADIKSNLLWSKETLKQAIQSSQDPGTSPLLESREGVRQGRMLEWSKMGPQSLVATPTPVLTPDIDGRFEVEEIRMEMTRFTVTPSA
ncbi:uncharacterized protein LOC144486126 [Mustelus asterias]